MGSIKIHVKQDKKTKMLTLAVIIYIYWTTGCNWLRIIFLICQVKSDQISQLLETKSLRMAP